MLTPRLRWLLLVGIGLPVVFAGVGPASGQESWGGEKSFHHARKVRLTPGSASPAVVVTEFLTQGDLLPDGRNLVVVDGDNRPVSWCLLQTGPGDFCRLAFRAVPKQTVYTIYHGGPPRPVVPPAWTPPTGLLLETRRWQDCDLTSLASVQKAFAAAEPVGADLVPNVYHRFNPFAPGREPFLSRYRGTLQVESAGTYRFFTSSQDCSVLLIDGKPVVSAPGIHGPVGDARIKGEVTLREGWYKFEYVHAAAGPEACMLAAWQPPGAGQPEVIPAGVFGSDRVAHLPAGDLRHWWRGPVREFTAEVVDEVPLASSELPLIRVRFKEVSARATQEKLHWEFGDGQSGDATDPVHVYLHPGVYPVKMTPFGVAPMTCRNRVPVQRAVVFGDRKAPDKLADYLPLLDRYDLARLDPGAVLQLTRAYHEAGQLARSAKVGKAGLLNERLQKDEEVARALVVLVGPILRDHLDDPFGALAAWQTVGRAVRRMDWKAACEIEAADIALNDLLQRREARALLEAADARLAQVNDPALASRLRRVWGDWYARSGDKMKAREAYAQSAALQVARRTETEQNAWRGAHSRSAEAFLRGGDLGRALQELRSWQEEFPADRIEGYLPLLQARYWEARGKLQHVVIVAGDLIAVNPDSAYADQLAYLAAGCEEKLGRADRAVAAYRGFLTDYPGSPLVPEAKQRLARLTSGKASPSGK